MSTIPAIHQAIAFNAYGETPFNDLGLCDCPAQDNLNYAGYLIQEGDVTPIQFINDCELSDLGEELISNGGFEEGTGETTITDWTRTVASPEDTTVIRSDDDPFDGGFSAKWIKTVGTASQAEITQDTGHTFLAGELYLLEFYAHMHVNPSFGSGGYGGYLIITIGGLYTFTFTPSVNGSYTKFSRYIPMDFNGTDSDIVIRVDTINPAPIDFLWVDNVSLKQVEIPDECGECPFDMMFNGDFELGVTLDNDFAIPTFDGWDTVQGEVTQDLTGGPDGNRCISIANDGTDDAIIQSQFVLFADYDYVLEFYAKSIDPTGTVVVALTTFGTILTQPITNQWEKYSVIFNTSAGTELLTFQNSDTAPVLLDNVVLKFVVPNLNDIYVVDEDGNTTFIPESMITNFDGGFNVNIDWSELYPEGIPECFTVCIDPCEGNMIQNGHFEEGTGTTFTDWTNVVTAPGTVTEAELTNLLLRSEEFDNATWQKLNSGTGVAPVVTANNIAAPNGTLTADRIVFNSGAGITASDFSIMQQDVVTSVGVNYTGSIWLKGAIGGEQILFRHVGASMFTLIALTTEWVRYELTENANTGSFQFGIRQAVNGTINSTATVYAWGSQLEIGQLTSQYIPTTSAQVTVDNGVSNTRAPQLNSISGTGVASVSQGGLTIGQTYIVTVWAKKVRTINATYLDINDGVNLRNYASQLLTEDFRRYQFTFIATTVNIRFTIDGDLSGIANLVIDNVAVYLESDYQGYCSEEFKLIPSDTCTRELVWYNSSNAYGINYDSGFTNVIRVGNNFNLGSLAYPSEMTKELNGTETEITNATIKKQYDLLIGGIPEYLHDRLAVMVRHDHIFLGTKGLVPVEDTNYTVEPENTNHSCLLNATVTLAISGENLAEKSVNCSE